MQEVIDAVVIGAGHAGLGASYYLKQNDLRHVVYERGEIGETWRSQRWDSFAVNTPNFINGLPGYDYDGDEPDGFLLRDELVAFFEQYAARFDLPVQTGVTVTEVSANGKNFHVKAQTKNGEAINVKARNVIVASGILQTPMIPALRERVPQDILQLHTADYRNPDDLPQGAVVIVGSGQSGMQITEDIMGTGRDIYLCTSKVGRVARRYRGRDMLDWGIDFGFWDTTPDQLPDPAMMKLKQPQISGVGRHGKSVSLQHVAKQGVKIVGRLVDVSDGVLTFDDSAKDNVRFGDQISARFKTMVDDFLAREGIEPPQLEPDPADEPDPDASCVSDIQRLDLAEANVRTIIWATGFTGKFDWLNLPVLDDEGMPIYERGVSPVDSLYFLGFPWLHKRKSGIIYGIDEDAQYVVDQIIGRSA